MDAKGALAGSPPQKRKRKMTTALRAYAATTTSAAKGAVPRIVGNNVIEVAIGNDRYRLPANTGGAK
jgi:hypothetical protein